MDGNSARQGGVPEQPHSQEDGCGEGAPSAHWDQLRVPPQDCWALESSVVALRLPEVILPPLSQFLKMDVMWLRGEGSESSNSQRGC